MRRIAAVLTLIAPAFADLRLNDIQAIGSHNSYHVAPPEAVVGFLSRFNRDAEAWNYTHPPLARQLDLGVRQFELDVFADPKGGLFADPLGIKLATAAGKKPPAFDPDGHLKKPGFKVLHVPDVDCWSHCPTLAGAFRELADWSGNHPDHLPIMVLIECKDQHHPPLPTRPEPFTRERLLELEKEILSVLQAKRIVRPDDIRGDAPTLREAVLQRGWPALDRLRGKFILCLDNTDAIRDRYLDGNPGLEGRLMFASAPDDKHPSAAWFKRNDPQRGFDDIRALVEAGFLVRTRADTRAPDPDMRQRAFDSGAQWISTDHFAGPRQIRFEGDLTVRRNPVTGGKGAAPAP